MKKLVQPRIRIDFSPSERQMELWNTLQPNRCDKCGGTLEMRKYGYDIKGNPMFQATCVKCGNTDIPEQVLGGGAAGGGKMGLLDSKVLTPFGFRTLKDIKVGDIITSPTTGGMQRVVYLHPIGEFDFYRVSFRDGTYFDCSEGHLWQLHESRKHASKKSKKYGIDSEVVWPTIKMYEWYQDKKSGLHKGQHLITPLTEPVRFTFGYKGNDYVSPYVIGALIGDGCISNSVLSNGYVMFINTEKEIIDRFAEYGYDMSNYSIKNETNVRSYRIYDKKLIDCLKKHKIAGNISQTHFIPLAYKYGTIEERKLLMQGLMDTDGYVDDRGHMSYTTTSKQLAEDVAFVVRSLGGMAKITSDVGKYRDKSGSVVECSKVWTVYFRTKMDPELCGIKRKKERAKYGFNGGASEYGRRIVSVEYIGKRKGRCISVSEPQGLYVVDDFIVTHNSYLGSVWLITSCMRFDGIRMVVARRTLKALRESTWVTLLRILKDWKMEEGTHYHINNMMGVLTFWNGSQIIMMELSPSLQDPDYNRLGSLEITGAFVDEVSEVPERAIEVLASRIRFKIEDTFIVGKILMTTNPALTWIRSTFVMDDDGNPVELQKGYRYIPFTLFDNPNEKFRMIYYNKLLKIRDKATRDRLLYGNWWFVDSNKAAAYWEFDGEKHIKNGLWESAYDPTRPLILSFDFNVRPFMSCVAIQVNYEAKAFLVLKEFIGRPKDRLNNTPAFSRYIKNQLIRDGHMNDIVITGDPAGMARSTQTEDGTNNFTIAVKNLETTILKPKLKILSKQPSQITRLEFINEVLAGYDGWKVLIDLRCRRLTEDFVYQRKNPDGTKEKKKTLDDTGGKSEKYGHCSDCFDYAMIYFMSAEYGKYKANSSETVTTISNGDTVYGDFDY